MQGRHQSSGRRGIGVWAVMVPLAVLAAVRVSAQDDPGAVRRVDGSPVILAADRIITWEQGPIQWVRLSGRAAAFLGLDGLRAREAVVRIEPRPTGSGTPSFFVSVHAEGDARVSGDENTPRPELDWTFPETPEVQVREPFSGGEIIPIAGPPTGDPVVSRGRARLSAADPAAAEAIAGSEPGSGSEGNPERPPLPPQQTTVEAVPLPPTPPRIDGEVTPVTLFQVGPDDLPPEPDRESTAAPAPRRAPPVVEMPPPPPSPTLDGPFADPSATQFRQDVPFGDNLPEPTLPEIPLLPEIEPAPEAPDADLPEVLTPVDPGGPPAGNIREVNPLVPGSQRVVNIYPLNPGLTKFRRLSQLDDGTETYIANGGIQIVVDDPERGIVDITARNAVIWTRGGSGGGSLSLGSSSQSTDDPLEVYLEGDVELRQDKRDLAGVGDQVRYQARRFYADLRTERFFALEAELEQYAPGLLTPLRTEADSIAQFREEVPGPDGLPVLGLPAIQARNAVTTGSPFANPGYRLNSSVVDLFKLAPGDRRGPLRRRLLNPLDESNEDVFLVDARNNLFFMGPVPFFYWPRFLTTTEDINPPLEQLSFRTNNLFGQMILTDWDGFKLLGLRQPKWVDDWNIDIDYLSDRGFALGSEFGYFGDDFSSELLGRDLLPNVNSNYFGYIDLWGINDRGVDNLGGGPAIVTDGPPQFVAFRNSVPPFQDFRGRILFRHMQSLLPDDADPLDDFRIQFEAAYISDRHFMQQFFKRLFDSGLDQRTRIYGIRQWGTQAVTATTEAMPLDWFTQSQWYPKLDYYKIGGAPFGLDRYVQYFQRTGVSYANTQTASEVNNPNLFFGFLPFDPNTLTSGPFRTGRLYTNHELDVPIKLGGARLVPYVQGQLMGWDNQYTSPLPSIGFNPALEPQDYIRGPQGSLLGRAWGAYGARADIAFYRAFPRVENELMNVHGLMHKSVLFADYRNAFSTLSLNRIGVQEDLDDNTYEFVRRYFALNDYGTGVLPAQYNPLLLTLRRTASPISGTVDVQDSIHTLKVGTSQRLQTKRGPIDDRRIIDFMTLDLWTFYFPEAQRDNFGLPFGQTQYQYEWFLGDRTSIVSTGWFDYFDIIGDPRAQAEPNDGISIITAGVNINRPPRGTMMIAYSIIDTGPINTSALNASYGYWLSPKWYSTFGGLYDFGEGMLLSTTFSLTRIGADFLTTVGLSYTPLQENYSFVFELVPRFSPRTRLGSANGVPFRPDLRFAPIQ